MSNLYGADWAYAPDAHTVRTHAAEAARNADAECVRSILILPLSYMMGLNVRRLIVAFHTERSSSPLPLIPPKV